MKDKFPSESVSEALERSLRNAKDLRAVHSVTVAAARTLARRIDYLAENDFITESQKFDNVTVPTFLKYLQSLGLTLDSSEAKAQDGVRVQKSAGKPVDMLTAFRKKHEIAG